MKTDLRIAHFREIKEYLTSKRALIYAAMERCSPCTACELADKIKWDKTSVRPRLTELHQAGLVEATGERRRGEYEFRHVPLALAEQRRREQKPARPEIPPAVSEAARTLASHRRNEKQLGTDSRQLSFC